MQWCCYKIYFWSVNYFDIIIAVPLIWFGYKGFTKGIIIEITSILAFILGIWGGIYFSDYISDAVIDNINSEYEPIISFTIIFVAIVILVFILGKLLEKIINIAQLKIANKLGGAAFGVAKVVLMLSFLVTIIDRYDQQFELLPQDMKNESTLYQPLCDISKIIVPAVQDSRTFTDSKFDFDFDFLKSIPKSD